VANIVSQLPTICGGIVLPLLAVALTWTLRGRSFVQTSWADLLLALLLFDLALAMSSGTASALIGSDELRPHATTIFLVLGFLSLLLMIVSILHLEKQLTAWHTYRDLIGSQATFAKPPARVGFPLVRVVTITIAFMVVLALHFVALVYR
jgi:uncharacterized membrane-anchored protein YitT (DUF2179 family)